MHETNSRMLKHKVSSMGRICLKIIDILFMILILAILFSTLLLDKNINNPFPNVVKYSNGGYYYFAFLLFCAIAFILVKINKKDMKTKTFYIVVGTVAFVTLIAQTIVAFWAPDVYYEWTDFGCVQDMAIKLSQGGYVWEDYFAEFHHNVPIVIIFSWIYGIADSWSLVIWAGAILTNLATVLSALTIYQISKNKRISIVVLVIAECLVGMSWRSYIAYTDSWGMLFTIATLWIFTLNIKIQYKGPLIVVFGLVGAWIRMTVLIPLIGIGIYVLLKALVDEEFKIKKDAVISLVLCIVLAVGGIGLSKFLLNQYGYERSQSARGLQYLLMMGQDESGLGTVGGGQYKTIYADLCDTYHERSERMDACVKVALDWIKERGIWRNIRFYLKKVNVAYNDGYFDHVEPYDKSTADRNLIYDLYVSDGRYYLLRADIMQVFWDFVLLLISADIIVYIFGKKSREGVYSIFKLTFVGITLYLMLFEDRSKYLFVFLPVYVAYAGLMLNELLIGIGQINAKSR